MIAADEYLRANSRFSIQRSWPYESEREPPNRTEAVQAAKLATEAQQHISSVQSENKDSEKSHVSPARVPEVIPNPVQPLPSIFATPSRNSQPVSTSASPVHSQTKMAEIPVGSNPSTVSAITVSQDKEALNAVTNSAPLAAAQQYPRLPTPIEPAVVHPAAGGSQSPSSLEFQQKRSRSKRSSKYDLPPAEAQFDQPSGASMRSHMRTPARQLLQFQALPTLATDTRMKRSYDESGVSHAASPPLHSARKRKYKYSIDNL